MSFDTNQRLNGLHPLNYMGANAVQPTNFVTRPAPPNSGDSKNFQLGTIWLDTSGYPNTLPKAENVWMLVALVGNQATWIDFAGSGDLKTLTGNSGGAVSGNAAHNINILGDATTINVVGSPGTNTLTVSTTGSIASSFPTDFGTATPSAGVLNIIANNAATNAGASIKFTGSGNTVTYNNTDASNNIFIGKLSGNLTTTATSSTAIGRGSLTSLTSGVANTAIGDQAGLGLQDGVANVFIGITAGSVATSSSFNTVVGSLSAPALTSGLGSVFIGYSAGNNTTGGNHVCIGANSSSGTSNESSNIVIGAFADSGVGNSNKLLIGSGAGTGNGQLNKAFIHGIRGITPANGDVLPVIIDSAGQLGTGGVSAVPSFLAFKSANSTNVTGKGPLPVTVISDTKTYDIGNNYNNATGVFIAPTAGMYMFATCVSAGSLTAAMTSGLIYFLVSGA